MGKTLEYLGVTLDHPQAVYKAGELLGGYVTVKLKENMTLDCLCVFIKGRSNVEFYGGSKNHEGFRADETYINHTLHLYGSATTKNIQLRAGQHRYDFQFNLPVNCPSSFEAVFGKIKYSCQACVFHSGHIKHDSKTSFTVLSKLDLNKEQDSLKSPVELSDREKMKGLCCGRGGNIGAYLKINKTCFVPGENIFLYAKIYNNSNVSIESSKATLKQYVEFHGYSDRTGELETYGEFDEIVSVKKGRVSRGQSSTWENVPLRVPPLPPSRLDNCNIINITYELKFYVKAPFASIKLEKDIVIGTVPLQHTIAALQQKHRVPRPVAPLSAADAPLDVLLSDAASLKSMDFDLLPSYEECTSGRPAEQTKGGDAGASGTISSWTPSYPTYDFDYSGVMAETGPSSSGHPLSGDIDQLTHSLEQASSLFERTSNIAPQYSTPDDP